MAADDEYDDDFEEIIADEDEDDFAPPPAAKAAATAAPVDDMLSDFDAVVRLAFLQRRNAQTLPLLLCLRLLSANPRYEPLYSAALQMLAKIKADNQKQRWLGRSNSCSSGRKASGAASGGSSSRIARRSSCARRHVKRGR